MSSFILYIYCKTVYICEIIVLIARLCNIFDAVVEEPCVWCSEVIALQLLTGRLCDMFITGKKHMLSMITYS